MCVFVFVFVLDVADTLPGSYPNRKYMVCLEGGHDWEGGGEEGTVLVGLKKNQKVKVKPKKLFFSNHQI